MIVFSHANSFGAGTYRLVLQGLRAAGHDVQAIERFGHDQRHPIGRNWRGMTEQLLSLIDGIAEPRVWLLGHSMGGYLSLIAAGQRPERVRGIVLLDSPIIAGWRSNIVSMMKLTGQMRYIPQVTMATRRRREWASLEEAHRHFSGKPMFAAWHPEVLRDYVETGTEPDPADRKSAVRRLAFQPEIEANIYSTVPHWLEPYLYRHPVTAPIAFVGGRHSDVIPRCGLAATRRITHNRVSWLNGSHLFPFEMPDETVGEILGWIGRMQSNEAERKSA